MLLHHHQRSSVRDPSPLILRSFISSSFYLPSQPPSYHTSLFCWHSGFVSTRHCYLPSLATLYYTSEQAYSVIIFFLLTHFTYHNTLQFYPGCIELNDFIFSHNFIIHTSVVEHTGNFQTGTVMNSTAINIYPCGLRFYSS